MDDIRGIIKDTGGLFVVKKSSPVCCWSLSYMNLIRKSNRYRSLISMDDPGFIYMSFGL
jgi:hypothetical protein